MDRLPVVKIANINTLTELSPGVEGAFVDPDWVFHDIAAGRWLFQLPDRAYEVGPRHLVLLPPGVLHIVRPLAPGPREHRVVHFTLPLANPDLVAAPHAIAVDRKTKAAVRAHFATLRREQHDRAPFFALRQSALMADLLALYLRHAGAAVVAQASSLPLSAQVERAAHCVQSRLHDPSLAIGDLARAAGLSPSHFRRVFQVYTGLSPRDYLLRQRLERARVALLGGKANCTATAEACGFASIHAFSKAFRRSLGIAPKRWLTQIGR